MYTGKQEAAKDQVFVHKYLIGCDKRMQAFNSMFTFKIAADNICNVYVENIYNVSNLKVHLQHLALGTYMIQRIYHTE